MSDRTLKQPAFNIDTLNPAYCLSLKYPGLIAAAALSLVLGLNPNAASSAESALPAKTFPGTKAGDEISVNRDPGRPVVWSHPAFANKSVYARNDQEIVCVSLNADER